MKTAELASVEIVTRSGKSLGPSDWMGMKFVDLMVIERSEIVVEGPARLLRTLISQLDEGLGHYVSRQFIESYTWNFEL